MLNRSILVALMACLISAANAGQSPLRHVINSPYQPGPVPVDVLLPDSLAPGQTCRVLYILPVEPADQHRWGNGMEEAIKADLANRYGILCVTPGFTATPWFADHPTDPALQQESHFVKVVVPWVEAHYPARPDRSGRLLLGFSKSGYGAIMLLLRHPDLFDRAVAWDAPVDKRHPDQFRMIDVFGTEEYFQSYAIPNLVQKQEDLFRQGNARIFLMPNRDGDHAMNGVHDLLNSRGIPHHYEFTEHIQHHWSSGWLPRAAELVLGESAATTPRLPDSDQN
jgi:enterochelin esterase-like enzyme